jgi:hypothetical protein
MKESVGGGSGHNGHHIQEISHIEVFVCQFSKHINFIPPKTRAWHTKCFWITSALNTSFVAIWLLRFCFYISYTLQVSWPHFFNTFTTTLPGNSINFRFYFLYIRTMPIQIFLLTTLKLKFYWSLAIDSMPR